MPEVSYSDANRLFSRYHIALTSLQYERFSTYARLLSTESTVQNVTRVSQVSDIWERHFLDSAYLLRYLDDMNQKSLLDLGTGGGFPGIPLAIMCPSLSVTLLDSEERKLDFCNKVVKELGLSAKCLYGRAEELAKKVEYRETFDYVASRAVANGSMLCELALPFLKINGTFFAFKGSGYDQTVERFHEAAAAMRAEPPEAVDYELEGVQKHLIMIGKSTSTASIYPRRFAKIKRSPL